MATTDANARADAFLEPYIGRMSTDTMRGLHLALVIDFDRAAATIVREFGEPPISPPADADELTPGIAPTDDEEATA